MKKGKGKGKTRKGKARGKASGRASPASPLIVLFYKENCGFCKRFEPYLFCAQDGLLPDIHFRRIESAELSGMAEKKDNFGGSIFQFPTLRVFAPTVGGDYIMNNWKNENPGNYVGQVNPELVQETFRFYSNHPNEAVRNTLMQIAEEEGGVEKLAALSLFMQKSLSQRL